MKHFLLSTLIAVSGLGLVAEGVEAKRLGGGSTSGFKRQTPPPQQPNPATPATPAATPNAAAPAAAAGPAAAAAAAPKRSWMGPIAGLAAGLGLAALFSHLGLGAEMANFLMIALLAVAAFFLIRFLMRRFGPAPARTPALATPGGMQFAGHGAPAFGSGSGAGAPVQAAVPQAAAMGSLPAGFDAPAFVRVAKLIFIRMQAANDAANLDDLRQFSTPEMFAVFRLELQDRKGAPQKTDVVQLDAEVVDYAEERDQYIVSVRFHGMVREEAEHAAEPFDEVWHLVKPTDGSREWAIAGIAQSTAAA
ncbi:Tim44-like domain-containing protein [Piscinibacter gummiphilus]|uniref:Tim44-like domain-containing protein n=1 Tax=Piscinibacter gummiphilus TaxID=946333 RepID=A0ABZ0CRG9_9BURK|nr:Tim44-like domain-containing protein [Piscinibacter gummiphilus]WOB07579.1 Tim44-like domain-containing protein [Piscinibacter gummiphilus]